MKSWTKLLLGGLALAPATLGAVCAHAGPCSSQSLYGGTAPAYFNASDQPVNGDNVLFFQGFPPPIDNNQDNAHYVQTPITDSSSQNIPVQTCTSWSGRSWDVVWANRANMNTGANPHANPIYPAVLDQNPLGADNTVRTEFTSAPRAGAATRAAVLYLMGAATNVWQAPLIATHICAANPCVVCDTYPSASCPANSEVIAWAALNSDAASGDQNDWFKDNVSVDGANHVTIDKFIKPKWKLPTDTTHNSYGVVIDWEVQDNRTIGNTAALLETIGDDIKSYGRKSYLYTNPFDGNYQANGFDITTINNIEDHFDYIGLYALSSGGASCSPFGGTNGIYTSSINFLRGSAGSNWNGYAQIVVMVDLGICKSQDALDMYTQQAQDKFAGYYLFPDVPLGTTSFNPTSGGQANSVIYPLVYGSLPPVR